MIKSILFYFFLYIWTIFLGIIFIPFLFLQKERLYKPAYMWIKGIFFLLKIICNITYRVNGNKNIPDEEAFIIASKHQSAFETLLLFSMFQKAIFIHKYELFFIPIFGLYLKKLP